MSAALLGCKGVTCRFGGLVALARVDFEVNDGEIVGLIGPNGSGKTTLFNVITGIYGADEGAVTVGGTDMTAATPQAIYRAGVTRTFQRSRMCLPLSVFDNIMVGNHKRLNHGLVFNLLRRGAFAAELVRNREEAHELVKVFSRELAGRIEEPAAGLPHEETRHLMDDILSVRERLPGLTIVIIEHEMGVIERVTDRCVVLNYGRKIKEGTFAEVAGDRQVQEAYLGVA